MAHNLGTSSPQEKHRRCGGICGFPKIRGTILGVPIINKDYSVLVSILSIGSPYHAKLPSIRQAYT